METHDLVLLAVTLIILGEVSYLLAKLPKTTIKAKNRAILIDTSVLMDGRIVGLAATGFIGGTLVVPRSVIGELQFLADNADADKRARARSGLDVVSELQKMDGVEVELLQDGSKAEEGVDERLLTLAKQHSAAICTLDFNLNKVAVVEGIQVLNINELAQSLRMSHLPGERMLIELTQKGQDSHQGVGYLPDGTMVVVEQSNTLIGQTVQVEVVRSLQTAAGKMMFAKRVDAKPVAKKQTTPQQVAAKTKASGRAVYHASKPEQPKRQTAAPAKNEHGDHKQHHKSSAKVSQKPNDAVGRSPDVRTKKSPRATPQSPSTQPKKSSRRPTQKDREASFLSLIDNQQE